MGLYGEVVNLVRSSRDYGLRDQLLRSALSVPSNIAEGYELATNKAFIRHLVIAKGSCGEVRTQLYAAKLHGQFDQVIIDRLIEDSRRLSGMIQRFIDARKRRDQSA